MRLMIVAMLCVGSLALAQKPAAPAPKAPEAKPAAKAADGGTPVVLDGAKLWTEKTCTACHGKDAKTPILPEYPKLAGQNAVYAERQIKDIKSGARSNGNTAAMKGVLFMVSDDEIHALAQWLTTLK